ncbi:hypothetical protein ACFPYI_05950 [Halomarina salina]|uniref:Uncharacterized protein n=1 Tax=Halomarina salina TaxID=1872699 RepID=A0ABD5RJT6_9EURY|nr:hypothetical protein [Halomarina salina]
METTTVALLGVGVVLVGLVAVAVLRIRGSSDSTRLGSTQRAPSRQRGSTDRTSRTNSEPSTQRQSTTETERSAASDRDRGAGLAADVEKQLSASERQSSESTTTTTATTGTATASSADTTTPEETGSLDDLWAESAPAKSDDDLTDATEDLLESTGTLDEEWTADDDGSVARDGTLFESTDDAGSDYQASQPTASGEPDDDLDSLF